MTTDILKPSEIKDQVQIIQRVMKAVMKEDVHYGVIPGCGNKPTLLKPGAEKIAATFKLAVDPEITEISGPDSIGFRIKCRMTHIGSENFVGAGIGECSTEEEKFKWRKTTGDGEFNSTDETRRREVWKSGKNGEYQIKQVRTNPADLANTVLKMAKKRALVDAILTCTAASDCFNQDIEDFSPEMKAHLGEDDVQKKQSTKPNVDAPQEKTQKPPSSNEPVISEAQLRRLMAISNKSGYEESDVDEHILFEYSLNSKKEITRIIYDDIVDKFSTAKGKNE